MRIVDVVVAQFYRSLRRGGDVLEDGLQELAPLLLGDLFRDNTVRDVVHVCVSGDNPRCDISRLVIPLGV